VNDNALVVVPPSVHNNDICAIRVVVIPVENDDGTCDTICGGSIIKLVDLGKVAVVVVVPVVVVLFSSLCDVETIGVVVVVVVVVVDEVNDDIDDDAVDDEMDK
jgi:hypothetical protein